MPISGLPSKLCHRIQTNTRKKKKKGKMTRDLVSLLVNHKRPLLSTDVT